MFGVFAVLLALHWPLLRLPYFWDEAGYYIPAAWDIYASGLLIPHSTLPTGHTPLVMVYLALAWKLFGFSPPVTRLAILLIAAACVTALYALGKRVAGREAGAWSALLLSLCPLFFAQSSLAHLDLAAGLFTTLAVLALVRGRGWFFALNASLAVLSKETAVVLLPVAWVFALRQGGARPRDSVGKGGVSPRMWIPMFVPLLPLAAWGLYYHHATGFWTGNSEYLQYNLFSTFHPARMALTLLRRLYEVFLGGFNWLLLAGALAGAGWSRKNLPAGKSQSPGTGLPQPAQDFLALAFGLAAVYVLMLSLVGGAILPRYLLPIFPVMILAAVVLISQLPRKAGRALCVVTAGCFVGAWFINPPYPFPFEDNLAYADFIRLHQRGAQFLEQQPPEARILTAWPASDELANPMLGYVRRPLRVVPVAGFAAKDFQDVRPESFDLFYLYARKWEPRDNWLKRWPRLERFQERYFDYRPQVSEANLVARFHLKLLEEIQERGQWIRIYAAPSYAGRLNPP